ncbi:MAG: hypothetical protein H6847_06755 [Hyphomonas sp.]|nr:hypothetical protein [Hyphomonas sp.]MCB9971190.1 hypothetical protein [Hyphomonas sp.]
MLTGDPSAVLLLSAGRIIRGLNPVARELYGVKAGDSLGCLPFEDHSVQALADACARVAAGADEEFVRLARLDDGSPVVGSLRAFQTAGKGEALAQFRCSDFAWPQRLNAVLETAFGLTQAETRIVQCLVEGCSVSRIAEMRGSSLATVRTQIRAIYDKAGAHSQVELMHLAMGLVLTFSRPLSVLA